MEKVQTIIIGGGHEVRGAVAHFEKHMATAVTQLEDREGWLVETDDKTFQAKNVVVATGQFQPPKIPGFSANIPERVLQIRSGQFRNPGQLPDGAVLMGVDEDADYIASPITE